MTTGRGHTVLLVPVPELEPFARDRWAHYLASWISRDPAFTHAHITALAPYLPDPTAADLAQVAAIARATPAFDYVLREVEELPNGFIQVAPEPAAPFTALTEALWDAFPACPPYAGEYAAAPHVTLDQRSESVSVASTRALLGHLLPARCRADRLELHWYEEGNCHVLADWKLGSASV
ncbi:2'-5' RNA ligase family protein [Nocardioides bizhenqiangii]|uniref:2'-5' RNA ligase family protein n=1 Tax=Nocardioides bizhenqiangii TaxID=3095076 RepID=A0ABZ0ZWZ1_9ACTN|nr:2'-5' RNA ligase family protein [Nocardioides sp. HM61]WQQ28349.1 2'-5' RNA ligase family protein [Nocardioides sp. HM61]